MEQRASLHVVVILVITPLFATVCNYPAHFLVSRTPKSFFHRKLKDNVTAQKINK